MEEAQAPSNSTTKENGNKYQRRLSVATVCPHLITMEYAVRGQVVVAADKIADELAHPPPPDAADAATTNGNNQKNYPFDHIVYTNIGNPHSLGQKPLTWPRQVLALVELPDEVGVDHPDIAMIFPADAIKRAREIKVALGGHGSGVYTHSKGVKAFREEIANFIAKRDDLPVGDPEMIYLTDGASQGITHILKMLMANENTGVMIPIPQYPIYSATLDMLGAHKVAYYLHEKSGWGLDIQELERSLKEAQDKGLEVNSMVLINPGNPTGQVLRRENLHEVVKFCSRHNLVLLADEVYQVNVYDENAEFVSAKRAAFETGLLQDDAIELVSFNSISKGVFGECGSRGGYMELTGFDPEVETQFYKLVSSGLCSSIVGQILMSLMVRGPDPSDESYESHQAEMKAIYESLKRRSKIVSHGLDEIEGFSCQTAAGSMYCFPAVTMPPGAIKEAQERNLAPDALYAISLLESTGICVVPASGFGQEEGRHGFRTTFLASEEEMARCVEQIRAHYKTFCEQYA